MLCSYNMVKSILREQKILPRMSTRRSRPFKNTVSVATRSVHLRGCKMRLRLQRKTIRGMS